MEDVLATEIPFAIKRQTLCTWDNVTPVCGCCSMDHIRLWKTWEHTATYWLANWKGMSLATLRF